MWAKALGEGLNPIKPINIKSCSSGSSFHTHFGMKNKRLIGERERHP
jgi:hypothetical protein